MGKLNKNEQGFGAVEGILILVVVILLGVVGYMVYKNHHKTTPTATTTTTTPVATTTPTDTTTTTLAPKPDAKLSADHYSFTAPAGWTKVSPRPTIGNDFKDALGNKVHVEERYSSSGGGAYPGSIVADALWLVSDEANKGVKVVEKSPVCTSYGKQVIFKEFPYTCDKDTSTTKVAAFMQAEGGEVSVNARLYVLEFTNTESGKADSSVFSKILGSFIGDKR